MLDLCVFYLLLIKISESLAEGIVFFDFEKRLIWLKLDVVLLGKLFQQIFLGEKALTHLD